MLTQQRLTRDTQGSESLSAQSAVRGAGLHAWSPAFRLGPTLPLPPPSLSPTTPPPPPRIAFCFMLSAAFALVPKGSLLCSLKMLALLKIQNLEAIERLDSSRRLLPDL